MENKIPKNVRQIGNVSDTPKIYVEDYVDTFLNQICENCEEETKCVFLIGHTVRQEDLDCIYISGALRMPQAADSINAVRITADAWDRVQDEKRIYFPDGEIIGWCIVQKEGVLQLQKEWIHTHEQYFDHFGTVLILKNKDDEQYFAYKYKDLMQMNGHYIYYEKNVSMQNYMIMEGKRLGLTPSEDVEDKAAKEFRNIVKERIIIREEKKHSRYMRAVSALLIIAVLAMGVTTVNNYGKMQTFQAALDRVIDVVQKEEMELVKDTVPENVEMAEVSSEIADAQQTEEVQEDVQEVTSSTMQEMSEDIYIVEKGDTLAKISKKVYGDISHIDAICKMNGLKDGNLIFIGQKLLLP